MRPGVTTLASKQIMLTPVFTPHIRCWSLYILRKGIAATRSSITTNRLDWFDFTDIKPTHKTRLRSFLQLIYNREYAMAPIRCNQQIPTQCNPIDSGIHLLLQAYRIALAYTNGTVLSSVFLNTGSVIEKHRRIFQVLLMTGRIPVEEYSTFLTFSIHLTHSLAKHL